MIYGEPKWTSRDGNMTSKMKNTTVGMKRNLDNEEKIVVNLNISQ